MVGPNTMGCVSGQLITPLVSAHDLRGKKKERKKRKKAEEEEEEEEEEEDDDDDEEKKEKNISRSSNLFRSLSLSLSLSLFFFFSFSTHASTAHLAKNGARGR